MRRTIALTLATVTLAGCGRAKPAGEATLTFEQLYPVETDQLVGRVQMTVEGRRFETPPGLGERGRLGDAAFFLTAERRL